MILTIILAILLIIILTLFGIMLDLYLGFKTHQHTRPFFKPPSRHSNIDLFMDGRRFFDTFKEDISQSQDYVHIEFFIFREDSLGQEMIQLMKRKAQEGVRVRLLLDKLGSFAFSKRTQKELTAAGIEIAFTAKAKFPYFFYHLNCRNHCKIAILDGKTGYYGGFNVGDEYLGKAPKFGDWRDYHLKLSGEGIIDLYDQFTRDWEGATNEKLNSKRPDILEKTGQSEMRLVSTYGKDLEDEFIDHLSRAQETIFIGSPYFIPSQRLLNLLLEKLKQGVQITILLPLKKDHPCVKPASYKYLTPLVNKGARIFHFYQGFYHAKVFIVDKVNCYLGTSNFDKRSLFWNVEINGFIYDKNLIKKIDLMTKKDLAQSVEVTQENLEQRTWIQKLKTQASALLSPFL
ncbi:cardiolipin synthase [Tuberibacillus sp. Marseille-P3662]|uniref:cardiolipin synthase n=1 Tax=Tuberibacillus sp. Marseille-P3662 TaxID=1965358 RepID=UPI000A1C8792|nr:cardiolipin synthase [Tuberibacillus sp. Marseille-P3662]